MKCQKDCGAYFDMNSGKVTGGKDCKSHSWYRFNGWCDVCRKYESLQFWQGCHTDQCSYNVCSKVCYSKIQRQQQQQQQQKEQQKQEQKLRSRLQQQQKNKV